MAFSPWHLLPLEERFITTFHAEVCDYLWKGEWIWDGNTKHTPRPCRFTEYPPSPKISAIKHLRTKAPWLGLAEAKTICETGEYPVRKEIPPLNPGERIVVWTRTNKNKALNTCTHIFTLHESAPFSHKISESTLAIFHPSNKEYDPEHDSGDADEEAAYYSEVLEGLGIKVAVL